ncbi:MAG TPA: hypothetical protein VFY84_20595 [Jiangellales bacterium]|nr:hypothetical protein [Jiangellales bacterium]
MALSDLLQRLRPAGAPGAAAPVAVPAEEEDAAAAELKPVFDALAGVVAECDAIRSAADQAASSELAQARRDAEALVADALGRAPAERAAAAARIHRTGDAAADALRAEADRAAARLRASGPRRLAELTDLVIANLRADLADADDPSGVG